MARIAGGIAEAYYREIPPHTINETRARLDTYLLSIIDEFEEKHAAYPR